MAPPVAAGLPARSWPCCWIRRLASLYPVLGQSGQAFVCGQGHPPRAGGTWPRRGFEGPAPIPPPSPNQEGRYNPPPPNWAKKRAREPKRTQGRCPWGCRRTGPGRVGDRRPTAHLLEPPTDPNAHLLTGSYCPRPSSCRLFEPAKKKEKKKKKGPEAQQSKSDELYPAVENRSRPRPSRCRGPERAIR